MPAWLLGQDVRRVPTTRKVVVLTFDGGGNAAGLARILATLKTERVPGTFFLTGRWVQVYPREAQAIADAGHVIGNRTMTHVHSTAVADAGINIDMIVQNVSAAATGRTDISFTLPSSDGPKAVQTLQSLRAAIGFDELRFDDQIGKLSLVGAGMRTNPGISAKLFRALAHAGINIEMISTSEIRISVVTRADQLDAAVRAAHTAFDLDSAEGEAIVYGGTGR